MVSSSDGTRHHMVNSSSSSSKRVSGSAVRVDAVLTCWSTCEERLRATEFVVLMAEDKRCGRQRGRGLWRRKGGGSAV